MPRLTPLPPEVTPELKPYFDFFLGTLGFTPNSVLTMQRKPKLVQALAQLNGAVMDPAGEVDLGFRRLIGHVVAMFAHLDGWIDTMATTLEAPAAAIAQRALGDQGWTAGKHAP